MYEIVSYEEIVVAYLSILGREPDSEGLTYFRTNKSQSFVVESLLNSLESKIRLQNMLGSTFYQFNSRIDAIGIVLSHENQTRKSVPNRIVNYLGVVIDPAFLPQLLAGREGELEGVPIPANWHADLAEFAAALRAVDLAKDRFRMVELGCGWGCWLMNTGVAARSRGLTVDLIGAEADEGHVKFAVQACRENGFSDEEARVLRRIVGPKKGTALFPKQNKAGEQWGLEAIFNATVEQTRLADQGHDYDQIPIITFDDLCHDEQVIDLVHMDIQGAEADFIDECISSMNERVAYIVIGTHSRQIEGRIHVAMIENGWILEIERAALLNLKPDRPQTTIDGIQGWRNPRLRA